MLTSFYNDDWHRQAIDSGASGFLLKTDRWNGWSLHLRPR